MRRCIKDSKAKGPCGRRFTPCATKQTTPLRSHGDASHLWSCCVCTDSQNLHVLCTRVYYIIMRETFERAALSPSVPRAGLPLEWTRLPLCGSSMVPSACLLVTSHAHPGALGLGPLHTKYRVQPHHASSPRLSPSLYLIPLTRPKTTTTPSWLDTWSNCHYPVNTPWPWANSSLLIILTHSFCLPRFLCVHSVHHY